MTCINDTESLFQFLTVALPYEYSEHLNKNTECIEITKEYSSIVVYVTEDETEPGILNATSYDIEYDENSPYGAACFDIMAPDFNLLDAVNEIKQLF